MSFAIPEPPGLSHEYWMSQAMTLAAAAGEFGEVPVGAVIVDSQGQVVSTGANRRQRDNDPTAHAEIIALRQAGQILGTWYLTECTLYVTLEPCPMCTGAILQARIKTLIYGTTDPKAGAMGTVINIPTSPAAFHRLEVIGGVLGEDCRAQLQGWFREHRQRAKEKFPQE
ncbi:tRNA adenosine(34) deaminase TadA [Synechococcus sp. PCC 6312]|uniref:tRNA adenosine(34) deaminase TadA n=1 Tax=Synechococcus sp. (strain ATCC 27167 / PCC 6312) TaxID=195253 RepID=UPI00029EF0F4|nr:tRNA adenosine(34) deaminase TadA [Synechococcus sp. PCC 6312]AFY59601.1 cytosine/adenosine deaminase [Synechococcus sp. PCC 6312]